MDESRTLGSNADLEWCYRIVPDVSRTFALTIEQLDAGTLVSRRGGYGLSNIRERLRLLYGTLASLTFASPPGIGLRVTVEIPTDVPAGSGERLSTRIVEL